MTHDRFDITPFLRQDEGQYFDRKSLFAGVADAKSPRDRREVRDQVAEYVAAFANAEGGVLILGIEDDGEITGHAYPDDAERAILEVPRTRLRPPLEPGFVVEHAGKRLLVFEITASDVAVRVDGGGVPLRINSSTVHTSEATVAAQKRRGFGESFEARPSPIGIGDLDSQLLDRAKLGAGLAALPAEEYLLRRRLADRRGTGIELRRAAELLFSRQGPEHPNAGIRLFRVIGTERRYGPEHNVDEKPRLEGNLPTVLEATFDAVEALIRRPARLRGTRFQSVPEYPTFAWKEALLNAVAHRDYAIEGRTTEVWFFEDRLEVRSPGGLVPDLTIEELRRLERRHSSRNPRLVRGLVDLGFMRDQGEGIPRLYSEMEAYFLPHPTLESAGASFSITLRNTPTLSERDRSFVAALGSLELAEVDFRVLLEVRRHGRIDNARLRRLAGLDTLSASQVLRSLRDRRLLERMGAGSASYYEFGPAIPIDPRSTDRDRGELASDRGESASDRGELAADRGESPVAPSGVDDAIRRIVTELGARPRKPLLRKAIAALAQLREWRPLDLAEVLSIDPANLVERHLSPMVKEGVLERTYPDNPNHPAQAYRAAMPAQGKLW